MQVGEIDGAKVVSDRWIGSRRRLHRDVAEKLPSISVIGGRRLGFGLSEQMPRRRSVEQRRRLPNMALHRIHH